MLRLLLFEGGKSGREAGIDSHDTYAWYRISNSVELDAPGKKLLDQGVIGKSFPKIVSEHALILEIVNGSIISEKETTPSLQFDGWSDVDPRWAS